MKKISMLLGVVGFVLLLWCGVSKFLIETPNVYRIQYVYIGSGRIGSVEEILKLYDYLSRIYPDIKIVVVFDPAAQLAVITDANEGEVDGKLLSEVCITAVDFLEGRVKGTPEPALNNRR